ncbi:MAG: hypothetical protein V1728_02900 [Candidatus Micrarchaeota archaeon]
MGDREDVIKAIGEEEYSSRIEAKLGEYHHLITKEAAEHLLNLEMFGPKARLVSVSQASGLSSRFILRGRVARIFPPKIVPRQDSSSRTQRLFLEDSTGTGTVVLYDESAQALDRSILAGDLVEAGPLRSRGGEFCILSGGGITRVQKGKREKLVPPAPASPDRAPSGSPGAGPTAPSAPPSSFGNFEGKIKEFYGDFPFRRSLRLDGSAASTSLMSTFSIEDGGESVRVVVWDSLGFSRVLKPGLFVELENASRRNGELHVGSQGRLVFEPPSSAGRPAISAIDVSQEKVMVHAGGQRVQFPSLEDACLRLGAGPVPEGIHPTTILDLKKNDWIGKPLPESWEK